MQLLYTYAYNLIKDKNILNLQCTKNWDYYLNKKWKMKIKADKYNTKQEIEEAFKNPIQIHYATGIKPWNIFLCYKKLVWLKYLFLSNFFFFKGFIIKHIIYRAK